MALDWYWWSNVISLKIKFQIVSQMLLLINNLFWSYNMDSDSDDITSNTDIYYQYQPQIK
jgi:hypothetical protein